MTMIQRLFPLVAAMAAVLANPTHGSAQTLGTLSSMLATTDGNRMSVADAGAGRVTVVTFWLTSCTPSKRQLDAMKPLVEEFSDSVRFIAISIDNAKTLARVAPLVASKGYVMTVLLDPTQELFTLLNGSEHPYTVIFASDGTLAWKHVGFYSGDEEQIRDEIVRLTSKRQSND
jgi:cytochrome c biogenesis protein CcmG, thiol:disulfide interchange protein DsbE